MAFIGLNVARDGSTPVEAIRDLRADWVRVVATPENDLTDYLKALKHQHVSVLLVLARESFAGQDNLLTYRDRYAGLLDAIQVGNEPDLASPSSWTMTPGELAALGRSVRKAFPTTPLVCAGLASGDPAWISDLDLSWCDAVAVHPYLKDGPNPTDLEDLPDAVDLVRAYRAIVPDKPILVTEWGWWSDDETRAAEEVADMVEWASETKEIAGFFYFCASDAMVPPFGLLRADGSEKPRAEAFRMAASAVTLTGWPGGLTHPPALPDPTPVYGRSVVPHPWRYWSADEIARITGCPVGNVRQMWPKLNEQLSHCVLTDRATAAAMIATVAIETAHTFLPVREAFWNSEEWRKENLRYYPFYGRGFIQLTWESNYAAYGPKIAELWGAAGHEPDFQLVQYPDRAMDPDISAAVAALYFRDHGGEKQNRIPMAASIGNWTEVRRLVQGGSAGLEELVAYATGLLALPAPEIPVPSKDPLRTAIAEIRERLDEIERLIA